MNAKDRVNFIRGLGTQSESPAGKERICSHCGAVVGGKFCSKCGKEYMEQPQPDTAAGRAKDVSGMAAEELPKEQAVTEEVMAAEKDTESDVISQSAFASVPDTPPRAFGAVEKRVKPYLPPKRRPSLSKEPGAKRFVPAEEQKDDAQQSVLAKGLPDWSIEPPQVVVYRRSSKTLS